MNVNHVEAVVEILAEGPVLDRLFQVSMRCRQDADVHLDDFLTADPFKLAILQDLEQLRLEAYVHISDLVEQNGAAIGGFEHARLLLEGPGKGASLIPEELAFHQLRGQSGTIQLQKDFAGAR